MKKYISAFALTMTLLSSSLQITANASSDLIYFGSWHSEVPKIQKTLSDKGYFSHEVTGYFGNITKNAVMRFQKDEKISVDGIVGPVTRSKLYENDYTQNDLYWLSRIVHAEAEGESYQGKVAVANTILNRVKHKEYPNTIYGVIFDKKFGIQYSPTADGRIYNTPNTDSIRAAKSALEGYNNVGNSMYFYNPKKAFGSWIKNNRKFYVTIGNHNFHL